jgi:hypothetical protein
MRHLVETARGTILIEREGPYGTVNTFGPDAWEDREIIFKGESELLDGLMEIGLDAANARKVSSDYWNTWDSRFSDSYYVGARHTMRLVVIFAVAVAIVVVGVIDVAVRLMLR